MCLLSISGNDCYEIRENGQQLWHRERTSVRARDWGSLFLEFTSLLRASSLVLHLVPSLVVLSTNVSMIQILPVFLCIGTYIDLYVYT